MPSRNLFNDFYVKDTTQKMQAIKRIPGCPPAWCTVRNAEVNYTLLPVRAFTAHKAISAVERPKQCGKQTGKTHRNSKDGTAFVIGAIPPNL